MTNPQTTHNNAGVYDDLLRKSRALASRMRKTGKYSAYEIFSVLQTVRKDGYDEGRKDGENYARP